MNPARVAAGIALLVTLTGCSASSSATTTSHAAPTTDQASAATPAASVDPALAAATAALLHRDVDRVAPGNAAKLLPAPGTLGPDWKTADVPALQGLLLPCPGMLPSPASLVDTTTRVYQQDIPEGAYVIVQSARYPSAQAAQQYADQLRHTIGACPDFSIVSGPLAGAAAHIEGAPGLPDTTDTYGADLMVSQSQATPAADGPDSSSDDYTYLVARQGDALITAVMGGADGTDLETFAAQHMLPVLNHAATG